MRDDVATVLEVGEMLERLWRLRMGEMKPFELNTMFTDSPSSPRIGPIGHQSTDVAFR